MEKNSPYVGLGIVFSPHREAGRSDQGSSQLARVEGLVTSVPRGRSRCVLLTTGPIFVRSVAVSFSFLFCRRLATRTLPVGDLAWQRSPSNGDILSSVNCPMAQKGSPKKTDSGNRDLHFFIFFLHSMDWSQLCDHACSFLFLSRMVEQGAAVPFRRHRSHKRWVRCDERRRPQLAGGPWPARRSTLRLRLFPFG